MAISTNRDEIIVQLLPLCKEGTNIESTCLVTSEPTAKGIVGSVARTAAKSGLLSSVLGSIGLSRVSSEVTNAAANAEGSAQIHQYYIAVTGSEVIFFNAHPLSAPDSPWIVSYTDMVSVDIKVEGALTEIIFYMKSGKSFEYLGSYDGISEVVTAINNHIKV